MQSEAIPAPLASNPQTRIGAIHAIPDVLRELHVDPGPLFAAAGIALRLFANADNRIPNGDACRLLHLCARRTRCEHFGLLVGKRAGLASLGVVGSLARNAPDVGAALRSINRYLAVNNPAAITVLSEHGALALWSYAIHVPGVVGIDQLCQAVAAVACNVLRELAGRDWLPEEILFPFSRPRDTQPFRAFYGAPIRFDAEHLNIVFARTWLARPIDDADAALYATLTRRAAKLQATNEIELPDIVRRVLRRLLMAGKGSIEQVAAALSVHRRTLDRQLDAHGVTFRDLSDEVRFEVSQQLLRDTAMSISEVAAALHYASPSAFATAFRRWSGMTASQWRAAGARSRSAET